jgi:pimeloyl-ACP methyl ester carboxylesterase
VTPSDDFEFDLLPLISTAMNKTILISVLTLLLATPVFADGLGDNDPKNVRRLPKLGVEVPAEKRVELEAGLEKLNAALGELAKKQDATTVELLPDVQIFYKAVHDALKYQEFHDAKEFDEATRQLALGQQRAEQLLRGEAPWTMQAGLVVRGYVSKIDGSVQPYGMVVPSTYTDKTPVGYRCDVWLHGRGETMTELNFLRDRLNNAGTFTPPRTLVIHPYGRWNNAFKFAGEVDVFEALSSAKKRYAIDDDRVSIRGFSMGGAGAWHLAVHYPDQWFAANPGAGFSETPEFLKVFQKEDYRPTPWEYDLGNLYNCDRWLPNLLQLPTVAYSGDEDAQKQAADVMERALKGAFHAQLTHVIGLKTKHAYSPEAKVEVSGLMDALAKGGRERLPLRLHFATYTLRYPQRSWLRVDEIEAHYHAPATVLASLTVDRGLNRWHVEQAGVTGFSIVCPPGQHGIGHGSTSVVGIVNQGAERAATDFRIRETATDQSLQLSFHQVDGKWKLGKRPDDGLRKKHGLQGPIDDAFLESFLMVRPTGEAAHKKVGEWTRSECDRAIEQWRRHFRGEARVKNDKDVTDDDVRNHNLVLWGDPSSNAMLAKIADKLPIAWGKAKIAVAKQGDFAADTHALIAIYPNPLNSEKYVVLNSGFTFREYAHLNNARQVPMLPDWAVVDLTTPPGNVWPGKIVAADFFDERWQVKDVPTNPKP